MPHEIAIETIEDRAGFESLREAWTELLERTASRCVFLTWEWLFTWWSHLSGDRRLSLLLARRGEEVLGIAPFAIRPPRLGRLLPYSAVEFLGTGTVGSDYLDLIVGPGHEAEVLDAMAERLRRRGMALDLSQIKMSGTFAAGLASRLESRGWLASARSTNICPFIRLAGRDWPSFLASLSAAHRYNFRRRLRALQQQGEVRLVPARSDAERRAALARLVDLHNARWRGRGGSDAFDAPGIVEFHEAFTRIALQRGWLRLLGLEIGGTAAAFLYGLRHGPTFYFYQSGFDPAGARHSVGLVTMGLSIRSAIEEGAEEFDMLHGDETYKHHWAREQRAIGKLELHPPSLRGWAARGSSGLGRRLRRLARWLAPAAGSDRPPTARPAREGRLA